MSCFPDGLFVPVPGREELEFVPLPAPSAEEVAALTETVARRITKRVRKLVEEEEEEGTTPGEVDPSEMRRTVRLAAAPFR